MIDIFDYIDYRRFLSDFQIQEHARSPHFSHRYFAAKAGFSSSGFLTNIIKGRRNLTGPMICKFSKALKLNKKEEAYFEHLVRFNQASSLEEKNKYYGRMLEISPVKTKIINRDRHEFYSQWWYTAVRELICYYRFKDDFQDLARKLDPPISIQQAKSAIKVLEKLGLIEKDIEGFYHQTSSVITTGEQHESSLHVQNFQKSTIDLAAHALIHHDKDIRDISTFTLTLSPESFRKAKIEIEVLQKRLLKIAQEDNSVDSVYQVNFQMFPLTRIGKKDEH